MRHVIRRLLVLLLLVSAACATATGQTSDPVDSVCAMSQDLEAYTATIRMVQHQKGTSSEIEFTFDFVPPDRMRIVYTAPATVEGQTIIVNASKFYTHIPSLNRHVWQDVGEGGSNQGEEMGFLYDFVTRAAAAAIAQATIHVEQTDETFLLVAKDEILEVVILNLSNDEEQQVVLLNTADSVPVSITIYSSDVLEMEIVVLDYQVNGSFDDAWFAIPER